jgi:hypothetical protein
VRAKNVAEVSERTLLASGDLLAARVAAWERFKEGTCPNL